MHPSIFRPDTSIRVFLSLFPANGPILHPSIEIPNKSTVKLVNKKRKNTIPSSLCLIRLLGLVSSQKHKGDICTPTLIVSLSGAIM